MVCLRYAIVNSLQKGDNKDNDNSNMQQCCGISGYTEKGYGT